MSQMNYGDLLEPVVPCETLIDQAQYWGGCASISIGMSCPEEAGLRAQAAAHFGRIALSRIEAGYKPKPANPGSEGKP